MSTPNIEIILGDITQLQVDAIVNAAHRDLQGGGGVDGAIHSAAGPGLANACRKLAPCPEGEVRITLGFFLPSKYIIHTVSPTYSGTLNDLKTLKHCHTSALALAIERGCQTIAFPAIGTGHNHFPSDITSSIAIRAVHDFLLTSKEELTVYFVLREEDHLKEVYASKLRKVREKYER